MASTSRRRRAVLSWAVEALECRRLLHHQIDSILVPDTNGGHWVAVAGAQADQSNESPETPPSGSVTPASALPGLPVLNSDLSAHAAIYLDFNGDAGGQTAYDEDGDSTTFNAAEAAHITAAWQGIATYFAPFDINVTTVKPAASVPTAWGMIGNSVVGGYSYVGVFPNSVPESFNNSGDARTRVSGLAHEYGHNFGLQHQSDYSSLGVKVNEYSSGFNATHGPIIGVDYAQSVHKWFIGHNSVSNSALQDDLAVITNSIRNGVGSGDGYRVDDYAGTIAAATPLTVNGAEQSAGGIIERMSDVDAFSFTSDGGRETINVNPTGPSGLAPKVEIYDAVGNLLASKDDTIQRNGSNNDETFPVDLPAGTYYIMIKSHGDYGDIGQYTVTARPLPNGWTSQDVGSPSLAGYSDYNLASDTYTVAGAGADIWGTSDQFQFASQTLSGDGSITARITSITNTSGSAKAGVMIRDTLNGNSRDAYVAIDPPTRGLEFIYRTTTGGNAAEPAITGGLVAPYWVRLTRTGNSFKAERSADGSTWVTVGTQTITMGASVQIGLAVTSVNTGALNTATFDNVSFTGNVNPAPTYNSLVPPAGLTVVPGTGTGLTLNWSDVTGETGFAIERSIDDTTWTQVGTTAANVTTYNDNGLFGSMRYYYRVSASDASGKSAPSTVATAINRPNAPFGLNTESISTAQIVLNWRDVSGESGYRIERSTDGVNYAQIATVGVNIPSYIDSGRTIATQYWYRVTATSTLGDSPTSTALPASTRLAAATGEGFTSVAPTQMVIHWNAVTSATGYRIERSTDGSTFSTLTSVGNVLTYTDAAVTALGEYYYRVIGTNTLTEGLTPAVIFAAAPAATALPAPWASQDIGAVAGTGASGYSGGTYTLVSTGADIWNAADVMRYTYEPLIGNGQIVARVATQENTGVWAKEGVMIRETTAAGARQVMVAVTPSNGVVLQYRASTGGASASGGTAIASVVAPYWVKLVRSGNLFTASASPDNVTWTTIGSVTVAMGASALVGLSGDSYTSTTLNKTTFDSVTVSDAPPTVQTAAAANLSTVTGKTTTLSVLGADDHGEPNLTYTWVATTLPTGAAAPTFSVNGTNAAKSAVATFSKAGAYTLTATIKDLSNQTVTSSVNVTVNQTFTSVTVAPAPTTLPAFGTQQFAATGFDQFNAAMSSPPSFTWSVAAGTGNTITSGGLVTAGTQAGTFAVTATSGGVSGGSGVTILPAVLGRYIYYNNSYWNDPAFGHTNDNAFDAGKSALLPGQTATFANYSGSLRGINGVMIDLTNVPTTATLSASDFNFAVGNDSNPGAWLPPSALPTITLRRGQGTGGSDRVELTWADNTIQQEWLQVTVNADANTGLSVPDVFYFGNDIGETGNSPGDTFVDAGDMIAIRDNITPFGSHELPSSRFDLNHDGFADASDMVVARDHVSDPLNRLRLITPPLAPAAAPAAAAAPATTPAPIASPAAASAPATAPVLSATSSTAASKSPLTKTPASHSPTRVATPPPPPARPIFSRQLISVPISGGSTATLPAKAASTVLGILRPKSLSDWLG